MKKKITYQTTKSDLLVEEEANLLELCLKHEVPIDHVCEGGASCGTCRVIVTENALKLPPRNELEQEMADDRKFPEEERLACQLPLAQSFSFKLPKDS